MEMQIYPQNKFKKEWENGSLGGDKMKAAGILVGGEALMAGGKRIVGKDRLVTDGPSIESKELIGGYYTVKAKNIEEVIEIAQDYPDYDLDGTVEIKEVVNFS